MNLGHSDTESFWPLYKNEHLVYHYNDFNTQFKEGKDDIQAQLHLCSVLYIVLRVSAVAEGITRHYKKNL
jgi:hypothetical protein